MSTSRKSHPSRPPANEHSGSRSPQRVDPRIKARRIAVIRAEGRKRLRIVAVGLGVVVLAGAAFWGSHTHLLDVDRIIISGGTPDSFEEVLESSNLETGSAMLYLDIDAAEGSIESLPWVRSAKVWRDWPATVRVVVEPRQPAAVVPAAPNRAAVIDPEGYVISWASLSGDSAEALGGFGSFAGNPQSQLAGGLPYVSVPFTGQLGDVHLTAAGPLAVVEAMPDDLRAWVSEVTLNETPEAGSVVNRSGIGLRLVGGASVTLGEPILIDDKISALRAMLTGADLQCVKTIDVTMPDIATVTRLPLGPLGCIEGLTQEG